jgi:hypothetical protein
MDAQALEKCLPGCAIGPAYKKRSVMAWLNLSAGIVGTSAQWSIATAAFVSTIDERDAIIDVDDLETNADLLNLIPILSLTFGWTRTHATEPHGGYIVRLAYVEGDKAHYSRKDESGELASLRVRRNGKGAIQLVSGKHWDKYSQSYSGEHYIPNGKPIQPLTPRETAVIYEYFGVHKSKPQQTKQRSVHANFSPAGLSEFALAQAGRFVDGYIDQLAHTRSSRNNELNHAAYEIGRIVGAGAYPENVAIDRLFDAALTNGYVQQDGESQTRATIASGLRAGIANARQDLHKYNRPSGGARWK